MSVHDWTRVDDGIFHAFHTLWIAELNTALNGRLLPKGYYALPEQHAGQAIADILTLHVGPPLNHSNGGPRASTLPDAGGLALAEAPPRTRLHRSLEPTLLARQRTLAIRHVSGHRLVAMIEIVSPGNKDRARAVEAFADKAADALRAGIHLLVVDLLPNDPAGMHPAICRSLGEPPAAAAADTPPPGEPITLAAYVADGRQVEMFVEYAAVGETIAVPAMPLFLDPERYVSVPLNDTYAAAFAGMPAFWREVLEGRDPLHR